MLKIVGFDQNAQLQTVETLTRLRLADIIVPAFTAGLAIWVMWSYDLTEDKAREIQETLVERRGEL